MAIVSRRRRYRPDCSTSDSFLTLVDYCASRRRLVEGALDRWLPRPPECPARLAEAMRYSVFSGGKRLRPLLTLMACAAAGGDEETAIAPACAVELVHCYSLVHDDLPAMDDDDLRRGRPTVHVAFDEATAILAGDALLTLAFELIARHCPDPCQVARCTRELAAAAGAGGMVGGQADDLLGADGATTAAERLARLHSMHARKTGALLLASVRLGAIAARAAAPARRALDAYGRRVGLAFQIVDDLLDVHGNESRLGKRVRKDAEQGKLTFPGLLGADEAFRRARQLVVEACDALQPLGTAVDRLREMAQFVVEREQ
ncbi:MAG: polyprenyl synthetase family protein [Planctomycetes bacterium]|nr:polyprenyl synthetase family protein [Planctomycetota bacterium]